jgi:hypothetical protein
MHAPVMHLSTSLVQTAMCIMEAKLGVIRKKAHKRGTAHVDRFRFGLNRLTLPDVILV